MNKNFWQGMWQSNETPWNTQGPNDHIEHLFEMVESYSLLKRGDSVWVPGAGHGHDAAFLADLGMNVLATDYVEKAVIQASSEYGSKIKCEVDDALLKKEDHKNKFDGVFDRAMLCALEEEQRKPYLESVHYRLRKGGVFFGITFLEVQKKSNDGPPYAIQTQKIMDMFSDGFQLISMKEIKGEVKPAYPASKLLLSVWQKL